MILQQVWRKIDTHSTMILKHLTCDFLKIILLQVWREIDTHSTMILKHLMKLFAILYQYQVYQHFLNPLMQCLEDIASFNCINWWCFVLLEFTKSFYPIQLKSFSNPETGWCNESCIPSKSLDRFSSMFLFWMLLHLSRLAMYFIYFLNASLWTVARLT